MLTEKERYYQWEFTIRDSLEGESRGSGAAYDDGSKIKAYFKDSEIADMKKKYPEVNWKTSVERYPTYENSTR